MHKTSSTYANFLGKNQFAFKLKKDIANQSVVINYVTQQEQVTRRTMAFSGVCLVSDSIFSVVCFIAESLKEPYSSISALQFSNMYTAAEYYLVLSSFEMFRKDLKIKLN